MAGSYVLPQVRVFQEFSETPNDVTQNLNPFVIGPSYQLIRYSSEDERADCSHMQYTGSKITLPWSVNAISSSEPDTTWYGVTLKNAYAKLGDMSKPTTLNGDPTNGATKFEFTLADGKTLTGADKSKLVFGTAVTPGDYLSYIRSGVRNYTKIIDISTGTPGANETSVKITNKANGVTATNIFTVDAEEYTGEKSVGITVTVAAAADNALTMTWKSSMTGLSNSTPKTIQTGTEVDLGLGLKVVVGSAIAKGTFYIDLTLAENIVHDTITVADLVKTDAATEFCIVRVVDSVEVDSTFLGLATTGIDVAAGIAIDVGATSYSTVLLAEAYLSQRNLVTTHSDGVYTVYTDADITRELGAITPDNPLAYALYVMYLNAAGVPLRFTAVSSDDLGGYISALDRASVSTDVYAICPLSSNKEIINTVVAHCDALSNEESKSWRIAFFNYAVPSEEDVTPKYNGVYDTCRLSATDLTGTTPVPITLRCYQGTSTTTSTISNFVDTVRPGDIVTLTVEGKAYSTEVLAVESNATLKLAPVPGGMPEANTSTNYSFTIMHKYSRIEYVNAVAEASESFKNHRAYNVFPNSIKNDSGVFVSGVYGAAAVCALACSVAPQQPITNVEIKGFLDIPDVYSAYSRAELNTIAGGGTLIIMQDKMHGPIYVRHQISTAYAGGNINKTELSIVKNLDSISYYFANVFAPYIGRYNLTPELLTELQSLISAGLAFLSSATETNRLVGPQILIEGTELRALYMDPVEQDKAYADLNLNLPAPFNNFDVRLRVI